MNNSQNKWWIYLSSDLAWQAMLKCANDAKKSIHFEQFIFCNDSIGLKFADIFEKKAKAGVEVKLLLDTVGSYDFYLSNLALSLRAAGVQIAFFHPVRFWQIRRMRFLIFRDHRKIAIIDGKVGFIGGVGIWDKMKNWRDTHVKLSGPIVEELSESFSTMWIKATRKRFARFKKPNSALSDFYLATNSPHYRQRFLRRAVLRAVRRSRKKVYLTTPYFVADLFFFRALRKAARRGVDVRVLIPESSDHKIVDQASRYHFTFCLRAGIKIYLYRGNILHAKTMIVDDNWSTLGSSNMDNQSFYLNHEANIISRNISFTEQLRAQFINDIENSNEVIFHIWKKRPFHKKAVEFLASLFGSLF